MESSEIDALLDRAYMMSLKHTPRSYSSGTVKKYAFSQRPAERPLSPELTEQQRDRRTVFVQQISHRVTSPILKEFCERAGPVRQVKIVMDKITKKSKGVAYVEFRNESSVALALALSGQKLLSVPIKFEITETEKNRIAAEAAEALYFSSYFILDDNKLTTPPRLEAS